MFIGHFTERPYQDPKSGVFGTTSAPADLELSNELYDPKVGADLYHRYLDEKLYIEEMGFDGIMLNEHHSTPFCMGGVMNVEAAILARITQRAKIVLLGNVLPIWDDPLFLAEELAEIDMISRGRLVTGWVRGTGRESVSHNAQPPYNWERFQEAHDFIVKAWTTPGPYRWEGKHYNFRYVNPWARPYQAPHPQIWIPGVMSRNTVKWTAEHRYPYVMLATDLEPTRQSFEYYAEVAKENGYEAQSQHRGYLFKVHVDETEELAYDTARKYVSGPPNPFLEGNQGEVRPFIQNLPGMTSRTNVLPTAGNLAALRARGRVQAQPTLDKPQALTDEEGKPDQDAFGSYENQLERYTIITGTPDTVIERVKHVLDYLRPGSIFFWDGDGSMSHDDTMRSLKLMGEEVLPAIREYSEELELKSPFEVSTYTNEPIPQEA
ncbi:MAG: LLM class flavin-dependent oxidoreductase [Chloroflexota bacterium]|nr:LLM class flavin-dependent oxidoreductase [Chloroflexota bacterium]MDE2697017.1 LLM class flavin-dependent oxidoreductase [Chloroflexota bacterium]MXZ45804.1 LLM class flavin-dependent oxidoreductase [Chloroflexota bacterium]MXZ63896.1 LLM class flavin-dependent oxidoreductase [Chloroflexota bacterium]